MSSVDPRPHAAAWPRRLPTSVVLPETTLWFNLEVSARRYPDKRVCLFFGAALTYRELHRQAEALAGWLQAQGVQRGDRVLVYLQNCPQYLVAFYAVLRADAVVVPVNPMNRADEFSHYIADAGACVAITSADLAPTVTAADASLPSDRRLRQMLVTQLAEALPTTLDPEEAPPPATLAWLRTRHPLPPGATAWADALAAGHAPGPMRSGPDDLALLPYTSGTTGLPKGCMHSHRTLMANVVGGGLWSQASADTVSLAVVPMFHITGLMYGVLASVYLGSTVVVMPRWDRELAGRLISRHRVTHWTCIPTMIIDLFGSPSCKQFDLSSLRYLSGGGAAMPQAVAERLQREFGITFAEGYGLTETAAPSHGNPPERAKLQCLGIPIFGVDSRVIDLDTLREVADGAVGEIVTHGPMVFKGYWGQPAATEAAFMVIDGKRFLRTGDLGRRDSEGYFFITDRLKRMINASGYKVWPSEVELLLYKCPWVQEACVIATHDAYRGESVKAVVVLRDDARGQVTEQQVVDWARAHMAVYKAPRVVAFADRLPRSGAGKVMWRQLQEQEGAGG
ncbi:MAG: long-chain fatty acid--CoA ligase [Leptothrix sp. (in: Bacteria)]|nr:long-chain fatty acid--CoA ligase [Leptothrix sp. (in: b-proteobacteria)]